MMPDPNSERRWESLKRRGDKTLVTIGAAIRLTGGVIVARSDRNGVARKNTSGTNIVGN